MDKKKTDKKKRKIKIIGTGMCVPDKVLTNADLEKIVDTSDEWITTRTGIKERRISSENQASSDLAIGAAKMAIKNAGITIDDIDLIMVASVTPDTPFPSTACWVQKGLGAGPVPSFDIAGACSGFLYGMILSESLILSGTAKRILLIAVESLTKITNWKDRNTCVLFGDGSGAAVLEESRDESGMLSYYWKADGNLGDLLFMPGGGSRVPIRKENVDEDLQYLHMKGNEVFKYAVKKMGLSAVEAVKRAGLETKDIDYLFPHQANIRIVKATGKRLNLPEEKVFTNIHKYGNMSAATIPIGVHEMFAEGKLKKGDNIVMVAFGSGFTWAGITYRW